MKKGSLRDIQLDDVTDFQLTDGAMTHMGLSNEEKLSIYSIIAGVLHLGNITFEDPVDDTTGGKDSSSGFSLTLSLVLWWFRLPFQPSIARF